jgi:GT2 family glycosyltransferase
MPELAITVAVATCGRPTGLARCLSALADGTVRPAQVVVVDQAPSRAGREAVERSGIPAARYVEQRRLGLSASRNLALELCTSDLLAVTDDDCVPEPGWVEGILSALGRDPRPGAVTGPVLALGPAPPGTYAISLRPDLQSRDHRGRIIPWTVGSGGNFAAPADVLRAAGAWDVRLGTGTRGMAGEDAELIYRLMRGGYLIRYEPGALVCHEWQGRERRMATRYSYAFGIGALCGLWIRRGDRFAVRMALSYAYEHARGIARSARHGDADMLAQHGRALQAIAPGVLYGLRAPAPGLAPRTFSLGTEF